MSTPSTATSTSTSTDAAPAPTSPPSPAPAPTPGPLAPTAAPAAPAQDDTDWVAEARKWERRAKENSDAAARLKEIEDAGKTAEQKATEERAAAEKRAADAEAALLKYEVTTAKFNSAGVKLTSDVLDLITGSTREQIEAATDKVLKLIAANAAPPPPAGAHVPGEGTAATGAGQLSKADVERLSREGKYEEIEKARVEGRLNDLLGIKP